MCTAVVWSECIVLMQIEFSRNNDSDWAGIELQANIPVECFTSLTQSKLSC